MVQHTREVVLREAHIEEPTRPEEEFPKLPPDLAALTYGQLMGLFAQFTRWADYLSTLVTYDEVKERFASAHVDKLEDLFMLANRPSKPASGELSLLKASMEADTDISAAREAYRVIYAHRKLMSNFFTTAERDAAALSRELTRRTDIEPKLRRDAKMNP